MQFTIDPEILKNQKLIISTPMYGGNCSSLYLISLINLMSASHNMDFYPEVSIVWNDSLVTRARNTLVDTFLKTDYDYLMFIDGDIQFHPFQVLYMLQTMIQNDDIKILTGTYPKKSVNWPVIHQANELGLIKTADDYKKYSGDYVVNFVTDFNKEGKDVEFKINKPVEVADAGTGFMMIKREVFEKFKEAYPEQEYTDHDSQNKMVAYFDCKIDPDANIYLSEDYMFTRWARRIGIKTWLLPWIQLGHQGTYIFNGKYSDYAELNYILKKERESK
jgi:glycosyltransferase involved in cell wall biosynthesis